MARDYDVGTAFARIEDELIASMMRNLSRHLNEEAALGFDWSQWQAEQLKALDALRRSNPKRYGPRFAQINAKIREALADAEARGQKEEELRILRALGGDKGPHRRLSGPQGTIQGAGDTFFRTNRGKLEALLDATERDLQKAEHAVLRRVNDQYRKIIFDAQVYANTGAGTVEKAVDMAAKDFLARGIDSIVYRNGARHTISDYADMAIRTAERRAYLTGAGQKRQEWGLSLVLVNRRGTMQGGNHGHACPHCVPWLGKVLVDDVYSGGEPDGVHPLLSEAMEAGFLHPRCKDGFTTYFPGISSAPDPATKGEIREAVEEEKRENRERYVQRQAGKYERLAKHSLDQEDRRQYRARAEEWKTVAKSEKPSIIDISQVPKRIPAVSASSVLEKVKSGEYSLKLSDQSYNKHLQGHRDYERYAQSRLEKGQTPPSFLVIPKEEAQKIIQTRSGTGIIKTRRDGTALNQEMITCDRIIGKYYSKGEWHDTNKAIIHHGRKGSHIVPHRGSNYD